MARQDHMVLVNQPGHQFKTRIPDDLHSRIRAAAKANNRSANAELVSRLEASFAPTGETLNSTIANLLKAHVEAEVQRRLREIASKIGGAS
jgi:Arc-like DNA binding domain